MATSESAVSKLNDGPNRISSNSSSKACTEIKSTTSKTAAPTLARVGSVAAIESTKSHYKSGGNDEDDEDDRDEKHVGNTQSIFSSMSLQRRILTMSALSLSIFIGSLEQTIVAGSLPAIAEHFKALGSINWIATSFLLASTAMQPLYGRLSDIFGRIETLIAGLLVFLAGAAVSGAASSMGMLIGGRVVQGLGASALISLVMVIVSEISIERERAKLTSVIAAIWAASSVLGPVLGGVFTQSDGGWRWVFYFSLPVGGLAGIFIVIFLRLPRPRDSFWKKLRRIDFAGMVIMVGGMVMVLLALSYAGKDYPWSSALVLCLLIFGIVVLGIFVLVEWKIPKEPIVPLRLFKNRNVGLALTQQIFMGATLFGPTFYIPLYFSIVKNSSSIVAGLYLLPYQLPISILAISTGFFVSKTGRYREPLWVGSAILTAGLCLLILFDENVTTGKAIGILIVSGIGMGILMQPVLLCLQTAILTRDIATGTTLFVAMRSLGGSVGLAVFQTVQQNRLNALLAPLYKKYAEHKSIIDATVQNQAAIYYDNVPSDLREELVQVFVKALRSVFYSMIPFGALVFILSLFLKHIPLRTKMAKTQANSDYKNDDTAGV
ncbi:hypothetical protein H4R20_003293 [Coemansia guatemalensis]|uniref:Major facilitator superfamily (MFS) profile domain-containing protein n=1 Tax=Coemansia guatemalensis TaxID=2761395 RepID=A0A9W8LT68_9FUNG|nr:hypothetical protein H4R20_003293 [Coemansia guatemalensis]